MWSNHTIAYEASRKVDLYYFFKYTTSRVTTLPDRISSIIFIISMPLYQSPESKKDEFRKYLQKSGAIDSLTSVLVNLYEENEKPSESTDYIQKHLSHNKPSSAIMEEHQKQLKENEALRKENKKLQKKVNEMSKVIETLKFNLNHVRAQARKAEEKQDLN
eukprot:scaffold1464_cov149-Skeletonema_menzelii.AAC.8